MFYFIFFFWITALGQHKLDKNDQNLDEATQNTQQLLIDKETLQIISIERIQFGDIILFGVLAEQKDSSYAIYTIKIVGILQNNVLHSNYEIQYIKHYIPLKGEKCLALVHSNYNNGCIFCVYYKQVIIHQLGDKQVNKIVNLNYLDFLDTIEIKVEITVFSIHINILQPNWQIQVFTFDLIMTLNFEEDWIPVIYSREDLAYDNQPLIKIAYLEQSILLILTENNILYKLSLYDKQLNQELNLNNTSKLLDIYITNPAKCLFILTRSNNVCQVYEIQKIAPQFKLLSSFNCLSNQLQLVVIDLHNYFLIENKTTIISQSSSTTYTLSQQYFTVIPEFKLALNYGDTLYIIYLGQVFHSNINEIIFDKNDYDQDYQFDNLFLTQKHPIKFGIIGFEIFSLTPFLYGPPFSATILEDEFQLITRINLPESFNTCLKNIQFEFLKMITEQEFIFQQMKQIYYLECNSEKQAQLILIRKNERVIRVFSSLMLIDKELYIFFDDKDGEEYYYYKITNQFGLNNYPTTILLQQQIFQSQIESISQNLNSIILNHTDGSKTLLLQNGFQEFQEFKFTTLGDCEYLLSINIYMLCSSNMIHDGQLILFLHKKRNLYQVNRYIIQNNVIQDLIMLKVDQLVLILKNTINFETTLHHYQIKEEKIIFLRQFPSYEFSPLKIMGVFNTKFAVFALDKNGDSFLINYDLTRQKQQCLLNVISYNQEKFYMSELSIVLLKFENNESKWQVQTIRFSEYNLGIRQIQQNQFKKQYSVALQINNLIIQQRIQLHFTGLDFTDQLIQLKNNTDIRQNEGFQRIDFSAYIYGPIHQVNCLKNCSLLHPLIVSGKKLDIQQTRLQMKFPIIIGHILVLQHQRKFYMIKLLNKEQNNLEELSLLNSDQGISNLNKVAFKLIDQNLQELIAVIKFKGPTNCNLSINVYSLEYQLKVSQFEINGLSPTCCLTSYKIKIRQNIFIFVDLNQLLVYQFNSITQIFNIIRINYQINATLISQDHYLYDNLLYFVVVTNKDTKIILIDINTQSLVFESLYKTKKQILQAIILDASENNITILYMKQIYPIIQHIKIVDNRIDSIHIQELVLDNSNILYMPIYFDKYKVIFRILNSTNNYNSYFSLQYQINEKENHTFPQQIYGPMDFLLSQGNNSYIFINSTTIGEISIFNQYEIQVNGEKFEIQVSNEKKIAILIMRAQEYSKNQIGVQITMLGISVVILIVFMWKKKLRESVKHDI